MSFSTPTTHEEMINVLKEIFYHYRIKREPYDGVQLDPIVLERLNFVALDEQALRSKAQELLAEKQTEERASLLEEISDKQSLAIKTLADIPALKQDAIESVNSAHDSSVEKIKTEAIKNGVYGSTTYFDKLTEMELKKNEKLIEIEEKYNLKTSELNAEIDGYTDKVAEAEAYLQEKFEKQIIVKVSVLKDEQEKIIREVFKYNNTLDEKEQRYHNTIKQSNANLLLKFMSLRQGEFTKDELVEMGYYKDVISCVCAYYDTFDAMTGAIEIRSDKEIIPYLDHYYEDVLYMYAQRALA